MRLSSEATLAIAGMSCATAALAFGGGGDNKLLGLGPVYLLESLWRNAHCLAQQTYLLTLLGLVFAACCGHGIRIIPLGHNGWLDFKTFVKLIPVPLVLIELQG